MNTLVSAINNAIQSAGTGNNAAATAFANAGVVASVHTDSSGGQELAFTSSTSAFQVQAGDQMANALMGNFSSGSTGAAISSTVTRGTTTAGSISSPANGAFQISGGGLTSPVTLNLNSSSNTTALAISDITAQVSNNAALKAAGITVSGSAGSPLVFTDAYGNKMNVMVTGDTTNALGFGSFVAGATPTAAQYTTITGAGFSTSTALGTADLGFSINGGASNGANQLSVNLAGGDATAATETGTAYTAPSGANGDDLQISVDGGAAVNVNIAQNATVTTAAADINAASAGVTATVNGSGHLVLTANSAGAHAITLSNGVHGTALADFGLAATFTGTSRSAQSIADALNSGIAASSSPRRRAYKPRFRAVSW